MPMYSVNEFYIGCIYTGEFIKKGKRYKIYRLPNNVRYQGLTFEKLIEFLQRL